MQESVSEPKPEISCLRFPIQRKTMEWGWGCQSAVPLARLTMDVLGRGQMMVQEQPFHLRSLLGPIQRSNRRRSESGSLFRHGVALPIKPHRPADPARGYSRKRKESAIREREYIGARNALACQASRISAV